ncbi:hypothetical protein FACS1894113_0900 [Alphaproteobacteria bacterium]|nr:hypothetical protein FACS1894113_0900 [Alphaproteobacteria bacterium]
MEKWRSEYLIVGVIREANKAGYELRNFNHTSVLQLYDQLYSRAQYDKPREFLHPFDLFCKLNNPNIDLRTKLKLFATAERSVYGESLINDAIGKKDINDRNTIVPLGRAR